MGEYDHFTRDQLISLVRQLEAGRRADSNTAFGIPAGLPIFGAEAQRAFESSASPIRIFDLETFKYLAVNDAAVNFYGYARTEFLDLTVRDTRHPEEQAELPETLAEQTGYLRHRPPRRHVKKSGEVVVAERVTQDILYNGRKARLSLTLDMTPRLRTQELLWQRQQEFETLAENLPALISRFDRQRRYVYLNSAVEKLLGIPRHDMIGKSQRELGMPEALVARIERSLDETFRTGEPHALEFSVSTPGGERFFETCHAPERDATGGIATVLCVAHDISGRKMDEDELRRQKNLFKAIIDNLPVGVFIRDAKSLRYMVRNRFLEKSNGYAVDTSVGKSAYDLFPKDQADRSVATDRKALESGEMVEIPEQEMLGRSGDQRLFHVRKVPLLGDDGRPQLLLGIADDITERKRADNALRESNEFLRSVIESSRDCIKVLDLEGRMLSISAGGQRLMEVDQESSLLGKYYLDLWNGSDREVAGKALAAARAGNVSRFDGYCPTMKGVPKWWDEIVTPILGKHGRPEKLLVAARDITEHKRTQDLQSRLAAIVESSQDAIVSRKLDGTVVTWNPAAERLFGYTAAEIVGRSIDLIVPPELRKEKTDRQTLLERGIAMPALETVRVAKDGRRIDVFISPATIRNASGEIWGISTIIRDVTERKAAEEALRKSEERFRQLAENIRQVFWITTLGLDKLIYVSPAYDEIWGRSRESLYQDARAWMESIHPEDAPRMRASAQKMAQGLPLDIEYRIIRPDGAVRWIRDRSYHVKRGDGPMLAYGLAEDITDWKRAELELRQTQQHLQVAVHGGGVGLWDWDVKTGAVYYSPEWKQQLGHEDDEIPNRHEEWEKRLHPDDVARVSAHVQGFLNRPGPDYQSEFRLRHRDGSYRWILSRAAAQLGENGKVERMFGCHVDVTEQKQAETERLENAVRQRDALVREVHHRIKNSLQGVVGLLRQKIRKYPAIAGEIEEAVGQLQSVALVYGLQETRLDGLVSLSEITDAVCASAESLIGGRVDRTFESKSLRPACVAGAEAVSVAVALNELVFNALKHQPAAAGKKRARVTLCETEDAAEVHITNRGRLPKGFDFAGGRAVGNGLGLVRTLLSSPGGSIVFNGGRNEVKVTLTLSPPLLADRQMAFVRRKENGGAKQKGAAAAHPGGGRRPTGAGRAG